MPPVTPVDPYVCVIGAANVDLAAYSHCAIVAEESNPGSLHVSWGGVGRNIAENLARFDLPVHLVTVLGDDEFSRQLQRHATGCGIHLHARIIAGGATPAYLCINDANGERVAAAASITLQHRAAVNPDISVAAMQELREKFHHV